LQILESLLRIIITVLDAASAADAKEGAGILGGRRIDDAAAPSSRVCSKGRHGLSSSAEPRSRSTSAAGGLASSIGPEVTSDGEARRWATDGVTLRVDGGGSGKVGSMGSVHGGSGMNL
jgi:hypothetical protein